MVVVLLSTAHPSRLSVPEMEGVDATGEPFCLRMSPWWTLSTLY